MKIKGIEASTINHKVRVVVDGDWLIHECKDCDFKFMDNQKTGESKVINARPDIDHTNYYTNEAEMAVLGSILSLCDMCKN